MNYSTIDWVLTLFWPVLTLLMLMFHFCKFRVFRCARCRRTRALHRDGIWCVK